MGSAKIEKVAVLDDGRFAVFPDRKEPNWQYIYREACGVYWNQELGRFHSGEPPKTWGYQEWYEQIVSVVNSGVGLRMRLDSDTEFDSDSPGLADDVIAAEASVQKWIDDGCPPRE